MKLIGTHTSPFVRKTRVVLAEKKIEVDFQLDSPWTEDSDVPNINPLGKVPVLILDDGLVLFDSSVIVEYLDNVAPNSKLMPAPNRERTIVKRWEAVADGIAEAAANIFIENKRPEAQRNADWTARQRDKVQRGLDYLARELGENAWCMGNHFSLADIAVGSALGYLCFRFPEIDWQAAYPNLARLYEKTMQRQSFIDTVPHD